MDEKKEKEEVLTREGSEGQERKRSLPRKALFEEKEREEREKGGVELEDESI
jgi:hypothetical protein